MLAPSGSIFIGLLVNTQTIGPMMQFQ